MNSGRRPYHYSGLTVIVGMMSVILGGCPADAVTQPGEQQQDLNALVRQAVEDELVGRAAPEGTPGPAGAEGPVGAEGPTGSTGLQGPMGLEGLVGPAGPTGPAGISAFQLVGSNAVYTQGNVGIGTASPQAALDVNGMLRVSYLGTTDNQPLVLYANDTPALRLEAISSPSDADYVMVNVVAGYGGWAGNPGNEVTAGVGGATISGGGAYDLSPGTNYPNRVTDHFGTVGGGFGNVAGNDDAKVSDAAAATIDGGLCNVASGPLSTVGGGWLNTASGTGAAIGGGVSNAASGDITTIGGGTENDATGDRSTIGGGYSNEASAWYATIGGGSNNDVTNDYATVSGGLTNSVSGYAGTIGGGASNEARELHAAVGGGSYNVASGQYALVSGGTNNAASAKYSVGGGGFGNEASNEAATVGGGRANTASGQSATVSGGRLNTASGGYASVVGGYRNQAAGIYSVVAGGCENTASGQYAMIPGGYANIASGPLSFAGGHEGHATHYGSFVWSDGSGAPVTSYNDYTFSVRAHGGVRFYTTGVMSSGVELFHGSSAWSPMCDRDAKENFAPVDGRDVLARLAQVPLSTWNWKAQDPAIRHMGPMAQDLHAAFGLGESDKRISTVDADGVALAAIQGVHQLVQEKEAEIEALRARLEALEATVAELVEAGKPRED